MIIFCVQEVQGGRKKAHKDDTPYFFVFQRYEYPYQRSAQPFYFAKNIGYAHHTQPYAFQKQIIKYKNVGG
ncbi:unnamed protein product [Chironomus riparius]|uniref:Uncharacterized protein n=1 Tax=Chironomus riparius TaxID=315576 RepID=A0A9N9RL24_9DIPT|nr:unnamed protein product [Chironomus riparius]